MQLEATMRGVALADVPAWARRCEELGFDAVWTTETNHDPFLPLVLAAEHTTRLRLGTGVALAFPRSPMSIAYLAHDLQAQSGGRFELGLGAQVRAHVERRFSAAYDHPAARMRELVLAIRAIWDAWASGAPLRFEGAFYRHTLMPPAFVPGAFPDGQPPILLAGVQDGMLEVAGEVADGLLVHPLQTPRFLAERVLPALARGAERAGRAPADVALDVALLVATTDAEREDVRRRVAFYATTPQYRTVLELEGRGALGERLHALSRSGAWDELAALVDDDLLDEVAVCAPTGAAVAAEIRRRYGGLAGRVNLHAGAHADLDRWADVAAAWRAAPAAG